MKRSPTRMQSRTRPPTLPRTRSRRRVSTPYLLLLIAGTPLPCNEVALHSEPELTDLNNKPYLTTDTLHANGERCVGRGEVWIRGPNVSLGYYKQPALTAGEFRADGFFKTGDIGMLTPSGALKIIDRKKNLVKLKGGEYVALERMNT
eukprot:6173519-Pleurochrysis_carterae.AAC.1